MPNFGLLGFFHFTVSVISGSASWMIVRRRYGPKNTQPCLVNIGDQIAAAEKSGGIPAGAAVLVRVLETDHLNDQLAALAWLRKPETDPMP